MSDQEIFSKLKCIRCGTKDLDLTPYKRYGIVPTCNKCKRKYQVDSYSKTPLIILWIAFITLGGFLLDFSIFMQAHDRAEWFPILLPPFFTMLIFIIVLIIVRRIFGSKLTKNFKNGDGVQVKSEEDEEWLSYRDWIEITLMERNVSENEIVLFIQNEGTRQQAIKEKKTKLGKRMKYSGSCFFTIGLISLIYGVAVVAIADLGPTVGPYVFVTVHLPTALSFLILGIAFLVIGKSKKKFFNL